MTHGPRLDEPLAVERGGATHYLQSDGLGSVTALTDADGVVAGRLDHDPFGNVEVASGLSRRFGYAGRDIDPTGLSYNRARYYQPEVGRFLTRDPLRGSLRDPASQNRYAYAHNNPISFTDPQGTIVGLVLVGFWIGLVQIGSAMAYDLRAGFGDFWADSSKHQMPNAKGYWDSVSARVQAPLRQLKMTEIPNEFIWDNGQGLNYPQRWHSTLLYLVVGLLYYMLTTTNPGIQNTPGMNDQLWKIMSGFLSKHLSARSSTIVSWIMTYYAAYNLELWLLGVYAFDEW